MKEYEALFIIDPEKEGSLKEVLSGIAASIAKHNGKIEKEENWGKQRLSYPIRKKSEALHYKLDFSADPSGISALNASFKLNTNILRVMITAK